MSAAVSSKTLSKRRSSRIAFAGLTCLVVSIVACGGREPAPRAPLGMHAVTPRFIHAFEQEAIGSPERAIDAYVDVLTQAATSTDGPASLAVLRASLDALVHRDVAAVSDFASQSALADRTPGAWGTGPGSLDAKLARVEQTAGGPFARPLVSYARLALAERRGDTSLAKPLRARVGCARSVSLVGPTSLMPVTGVHEASPLDAFDAQILTQYQGSSAFQPTLRPRTVEALGCRIPLTAETSAPGVREIIVDVEIPKAGEYGLGLRAKGEATLRAGGLVAIVKTSSTGGSEALELARVRVDRAGTLRLVARVGVVSDYENAEVDAWDSAGDPLAMRAPAPGSRATVRAVRVEPVALPAPGDDGERLAISLGALASGEPHTAEELLHDRVSLPDAPAALLLTYARAVRQAEDLPRIDAQERARGAVDRALALWPASWEAIVEHAVLAGARTGRGEASVAALSDLDASRRKSAPRSPAIVDAFEAATAKEAGVLDRARQARQRAERGLTGTPILHDVDRAVVDRTGQDLVAFECDERTIADRSTLACQRALLAAGDRGRAEGELARLRILADSPTLYLSLSIRSALEAGDLATARGADLRLLPGNRLISTLYAVAPGGSPSELLDRARTARDAPRALPGLLRAKGDDPLARWEGEAERVTRTSDARPLADGAATVVLAHEESYEVDARGIVHALLFDVRRVMGTTDVEANAEAAAPVLFGKEETRILRRRIFKKDGRILLPEATPHAAQEHAELAQLEAGDAVEAIYEGFLLPDATGHIGFDTPDLLPERTNVHHARIELTLPPNLPVQIVAHPLLGIPEERTSEGRRVLAWTLADRPVRRVESGVPRLDRAVGLRLTTSTWADVGRALRETIADLTDTSAEVRRWAQQSAEGKKEPRAIVEAIVEASGRAVKEASGVALMDVAFGAYGAKTTTARTMLATHDGSRTWLIVRALRELGIPADVVVAESQPFSDRPDAPPHPGRFTHPLAVARVPDPAQPGAQTDLWIDADVPGPPRPAGRISPELRGRFALFTDGRIERLPIAAADQERDEVDQRLMVDGEGNAKGVLTVLLRGRSAQDLAEALVHLVGVERQKALRGIALAWIPFATVENVELSSSEGSWQIAIRAEFVAPAYAQVQGTVPGAQTWVLPGLDPLHYVYPRPFITTLTSAYANRSTRESALAIGRATQYHFRRLIELPAGAVMKRLPGPLDAQGPGLSAKRLLQVSGTRLEEDFVLDVATGTIPASQYKGFVETTRRIDEAFRASTMVKPPPRESSAPE